MLLPLFIGGGAHGGRGGGEGGGFVWRERFIGAVVEDGVNDGENHCSLFSLMERERQSLFFILILGWARCGTPPPPNNGVARRPQASSPLAFGVKNLTSTLHCALRKKERKKISTSEPAEIY